MLEAALWRACFAPSYRDAAPGQCAPTPRTANRLDALSNRAPVSRRRTEPPSRRRRARPDADMALHHTISRTWAAVAAPSVTLAVQIIRLPVWRAALDPIATLAA
jgi:hypothetical protein